MQTNQPRNVVARSAERDRGERPPEDLVDVLHGLRAIPKRLPCRLLWDERGAELFARICTIDDYYLTRHEHALLARRLPAIATTVGRRARIIEPGSGTGEKTRMLLAALADPASYLAIDVEAAQLAAAAVVLRGAFPRVEVTPVCGDYTQPLALPAATARCDRTLVFFPGSTIGNFERAEAERFLARFADHAGASGLLLLGADSNADPRALVSAYDDRDGLTAEFDRNVLVHLNRVYDASFDPDAFVHRAVWDAAWSRIEMHLVSACDQRVRVAGERFRFARGESIVTEHCYKHPPDVLEDVLARSGWQVVEMFPDPCGWMRLWLCERVPRGAPR
jgi:dimethylhistidine N-methyltransferase